MNHQQFLDNKTMKWYPRMFLGCIRLAFGDYIKSVTKNAEERWRSFLGSCQTLKNLVAKAKQCLENWYTTWRYVVHWFSGKPFIKNEKLCIVLYFILLFWNMKVITPFITAVENRKFYIKKKRLTSVISNY